MGLLRLVRILALALGMLIVLLVMAVGFTVTVLAYTPQQAVPVVEWAGQHILGRELLIGEISALELGTEASLEVRHVSLANPAWAGPEPMLQLGYLRFAINLPSLWDANSILVREVRARDMALDLQWPEDSEPNWVVELNLPFETEEEEVDNVLFPVIIEHADLSNLRVHYRDPDQDVVTEVSMLALERDDASGMSNTRLEGRVNELELGGEGMIGPTSALQTGLDLRVDQQLRLGKLQLHARGTVADTLALKGADMILQVRAPRSRRILDVLGLEEVRDGPLHIEGRLADASPGLSIDLEGELANFGLAAEGVMIRPLELDGVDLQFLAKGPSMAEAGAIFGISGFRDIPYELEGHLFREGKRLRLAGGRLQAGVGTLYVSGLLPEFPGIDDWQVDLDANDINLAVLGPVAGIEDMPDLVCDVEGRLTSDDNGVELVDLVVDEGDIKLRINGVLGELPELDHTSVDVKLTGSNLQRIQPLIGLETLPNVPFVLSGSLRREPPGWRVEDALLDLQQLTIRASGEADRLANFEDFLMRGQVAGADLPATLRGFGVDFQGLAPVPYDVKFQVSPSAGGFDVSDVAGKIGAVSLAGSAWLSGETGLRGSRLSIRGEGSDAGEALAAFAEAEIPGQPFAIALDATYAAPLIEVQKLDANLGSHRLTGSLNLQGQEGQQVARGSLSLRGDSAQELVDMAGLDLTTSGGGYQVSSRVELRRGQLLLESLSAEAGRSDIGGRALLRFGDVPHLDLDLHSDRVYLPFLWPNLAQLEEVHDSEAARAAEADLMEPPTRREMQERLIPDTPVPLDWMDAFNGDIKYRVEQAYAREGLESTLEVDLKLEGSLLETRQLRWSSPVSQGWANLTLDAREEDRRMKLDLASNRIPMLWLMVGRDEPRQRATYRGSLEAVGETLREAAGSLNGTMIFRSSGAQLNNRGLDLVLGDVFGTVFESLDPTADKSEFTTVECATGAIHATSGLLKLDPGLVIRTDKIDVHSSGTLDLNTEALNIAFNTRSRKGLGISAAKAITPYLKISGNLANPWITLDPEAVAISGSVAIATGGISILAEGLYDRWIATAKSPCEETFKAIRRSDLYKPLLQFPGPELTAAGAAPSINN